MSVTCEFLKVIRYIDKSSIINIRINPYIKTCDNSQYIVKFHGLENFSKLIDTKE